MKNLAKSETITLALEATAMAIKAPRSPAWKNLLAWFILAAMTVTPTLVLAQTQDASAPPISQPLVREGTYAVQLVHALNLSQTTDEAEAENMLTTAGIAPKNGWISDYPVTPDIMAELKQDTSEAAKEGRIQATQQQAEQAFQDASQQYGMNITKAADRPQDPNIIGETYYQQPVYENFYATENTPIITYYEPPTDYSYLYSWVPYPFWWWNWWFAGYWIANSFIYPVNHHGYCPGAWYGHHGWHGPGYWYSNWNGTTHWGNYTHQNRNTPHGSGNVISNHFRDPATHSMRTAYPVPNNGRTQQNPVHDRRWTTPQAWTGARSIYARSVSKNQPAVTPNSGATQPARTSIRKPPTNTQRPVPPATYKNSSRATQTYRYAPANRQQEIQPRIQYNQDSRSTATKSATMPTAYKASYGSTPRSPQNNYAPRAHNATATHPSVSSQSIRTGSAHATSATRHR